MTEQVFNAYIIENESEGTVYKISSGSGGHNADYEFIGVTRNSAGEYDVKFGSPSGVKEVKTEVKTAREAIEIAREKASEFISKGMPGSGKITVPDFDLSQVPE